MSASETETVLHFLRSQVASHRGTARLVRGAVQFAITSEHEGTTEYWSLYITPSEVELRPGALPLEHAEPIVTFFGTDVDLVRVSRGEPPLDLSAEGDRNLFEAITSCFRPSTSLIGVRLT